MIQKVEDIAGWFILLSGLQRYFITFLAGAASALAMPPFNLFFVLFFTFPILIWVMDGVASDPDNGFFQRLRDGFKSGFFFGFGYFFASLWWIGNAFLVDAQGFLWALPIAVVAVPAVLAIFWGVATAISRIFWTSDFRRLFLLATMLGLVEYLRGIIATGFPWNPIASAAYFTPLFMQSASVMGTYGMTAFAVLAFSCLGMFTPASEFQKRGKQFVFISVALLIGLHTGFGIYRTQTLNVEMVEDVSLRLMQPNIDQREKFNREKETEIIRTYLDLSTSAGEGDKTGLSGTTHLIWPESVFPFFLTERRDVLASIAAMLPDGTSLITGAVRGEASATEAGGFVFNSVYVVNDAGEIISASDKTHLVPFGEYLPFQKWLSSLGLRQLAEMEGGFEAGSSRRLLSTGTGPQFLSLICYEIIFSNQIWKSLTDTSDRPNWIINVTNDGWFGNTPGPYQHERQAVLRGIEEGLPVVRVANTGISGVYDPYGNAVTYLGLGEKGVLDSNLPKHLPPTLFVLFGNHIFWISLAIFFAIGVMPVRKKHNQ